MCRHPALYHRYMYALQLLYCQLLPIRVSPILLHDGIGDRTLALEMAAIQLKPPEEFNFKSPDNWPRWRRRYDQFQVASGLGEKSAATQVSTFLYCLGEEAESVLASMNATVDDRKDYQAIVTKFDAFF